MPKIQLPSRLLLLDMTSGLETTEELDIQERMFISTQIRGRIKQISSITVSLSLENTMRQLKSTSFWSRLALLRFHMLDTHKAPPKCSQLLLITLEIWKISWPASPHVPQLLISSTPLTEWSPMQQAFGINLSQQQAFSTSMRSKIQNMIHLWKAFAKLLVEFAVESAISWTLDHLHIMLMQGKMWLTIDHKVVHPWSRLSTTVKLPSLMGSNNMTTEATRQTSLNMEQRTLQESPSKTWRRFQSPCLQVNMTISVTPKTSLSFTEWSQTWSFSKSMTTWIITASKLAKTWVTSTIFRTSWKKPELHQPLKSEHLVIYEHFQSNI